MKYAVVKISGSQFIVSEGDEIEVNKRPEKEGEKIEISEVLLLVDNNKISIGQPIIDKSEVKVKVLNHFKGEKVRIAKFKAKTGYRRVMGFRPQKTLLKIENISSS